MAYQEDSGLINMSREEVLKSIRTALAHATLPGTSKEPPQLTFRSNPNASTTTLVNQFVHEVELLSGHVHQAEKTDEVINILNTLLDGDVSKTKHVLAWDDAWLPLPNIRKELEASGVLVDVPELPPNREERKALLTHLAQAKIGLTGADSGLSDTGSLVLLSGQGRSRIASLLPPVHVALLSKKRLYSSFAALLSSDRNIVTLGSNLVLITGPSRTADIEMTLTRGVHGPRELHIIFIP